jgi:hypothetical protein
MFSYTYYTGSAGQEVASSRGGSPLSHFAQAHAPKLLVFLPIIPQRLETHHDKHIMIYPLCESQSQKVVAIVSALGYL